MSVPKPRDPKPEITLRLVESLADVPQASWDALLGADGPCFLLWGWLQAMEEAGCVVPDAGWQPLHLTLWKKAAPGSPGTKEVLVAAAPGYLKGNSNGEFVFDWAWADLARQLRQRYYPKLIVAVPFTPATGQRLLVLPGLPAQETALLKGMLMQGVRAVCEQMGLSSAHVLFPEAGEADELVTAGFARRVGVQFHWRNEGYRSFDDFLGRFSSKRRNALRRERNEVKKAGLVVTTRRAPFTEAEMDAMFACYASTVDKFFHGQRYLNRRFFELIAERLPGHLEFVTARAGSAPDAPVVGGAINLADPIQKRLYGRYWGQAQPEGEVHRFLHFEVCFYHSIEECIHRGFTLFEPGAGGEHKLSRGFEPALTYSAHHLSDEKFDRLIRDYLRREENAVRKSVTEALAESPLRQHCGQGD